MNLPFVKMHGLGNDFVVVDCRQRAWHGWADDLAPRLSHRRTGVGCDQVLVLWPSEVADLRMEIYNADGSCVEMCGNGVRCVARYARDRGLGAGPLRVETLAGVVVARFIGDLVEVDMGVPEREGRKIPVDREGPIREHPLALAGGSVPVTCVSMGNPHAVVFVSDADGHPVETVGPEIENHPFFPRRTNVEFVQVLSPRALRMRVWERGVGITQACGSGACAVAVAAHWTGRTEREVEVRLDGGDLTVRWDATTSRVFLTGPATSVFAGEFYL